MHSLKHIAGLAHEPGAVTHQDQGLINQSALFEGQQACPSQCTAHDAHSNTMIGAVHLPTQLRLLCCHVYPVLQLQV
jgi:hypothetical protein